MHKFKTGKEDLSGLSLKNKMTDNLHLVNTCVASFRNELVYWQFRRFYNYWTVKMNLKSQWILTETEIMTFGELRKKEYQKRELQLVNEEARTRSILKKFILFVRRRKMNPDRPFNFEKFLYIATIFFKRYFLVNCQIDEELVQSLICAIYLSLKISEFDENFIVKIKDSWRQKSVFEPNKHYKHYGDPGYSEVEQQFLNNIGYRISFSKLIQPIEYLYFEIHKNMPQQQFNRQQNQASTARRVEECEILHAIFEQLNYLYVHSNLLFLYEGSQLALFVVCQALKKLNLSLNFMGNEVLEMIEHNKDLLKEIQTRFYKNRHPKSKQPYHKRRRITRKMKQAAAQRAAGHPTKEQLQDVLPFQA